MCRFDTLYQADKTGYVVRCVGCEKIQVGYGNIVFTFNHEDFESFRWWLRKLKAEQHPLESETLRCIVIPTPCEGIKLLLSLRELRGFDSMLEAADNELRSLELLRLFEQ